VKASSLNPLDWKLRGGSFKAFAGRKLPKVLGSDFAGVVKALGPGASGFQVGQRAYGAAVIFTGKPGAHAELVPAAAKQVRVMPPGWSFEQAAALPVAALTALAGLRQCGDLQGKTVLVNGATGGVGHFALQIAKARGAKVTAVCSARNAELAQRLGADEVLDYAKVDVTSSGRKWDVFYDAFGLTPFARASRALGPKGVYATTMPGPSVVLHFVWHKLVGGQQVVLSNLRDKPEDYAELERLLQTGAVKPVIEQTFPLPRAAEAFAICEGGKARGKVILTVG
jgi:NADPH:quinone reductase-like Zn-dependent oxidoreductase